MSDYQDFLSLFPVMYSRGQTAEYGFAVWQWEEGQWRKALDFARRGGRPQAPESAGEYCGQLRAIVCERPAGEVATGEATDGCEQS